MPLADKPVSRDRFQFHGALSKSEVAALAATPEIRVLQTRTPVDAATWDLLNAKLFDTRHDIELRVYGGGAPYDLSFLPRVRNVRRFSADSLLHATGIEHVAELVNLDSLGIGIYGLEHFDFLASVPAGLRSLSLGKTKSTWPRLQHLERFKDLDTLYLEGQQRDIEVLGTLRKLSDLTLRSIGDISLACLRGLDRLWSLDIKLGGIRDLSTLSGMGQIGYLELWQVQGLSDLGVLSSLHGLQFLFLQSLPQVVVLPDLSMLGKLRRIHLESMKGLTQLDAIASAPALQEFVHLSAQGMQPQAYEAILAMKTLKKAGVWFGSEKKNEAFAQLLARHAIAPYQHERFTFDRGT